MPPNIGSALTHGREQLAEFDTARLDTEVLLAHLVGESRTYLHTWPDRSLIDNQWHDFQRLIQRRQQGEPVAYLIGMREFWSLPLAVNPSTLIPRPETELLVEVVLALFPDASEKLKAIDLGAGTGAIALALATEKPRWDVVGCDASSEAVALAESNRECLGVANACFQQSDWLSAFAGQAFDLIVSNPPYIAADDPHLVQGDVRFEPASALVSGCDGLDAIRLISSQSAEHLLSGGWLALEHGYDQGAAVRGLLRALGFVQVKSYQDLSGHERVTVGARL